MRLFNLRVCNENIEGTGQVYTASELNALLASVEALSLFAVADTVSGSSPTLTVQIEESDDQVHWKSKGATAEINGVALSTAAKTIAVGRDDGTIVSPGYLRLKVQLGGTSPKAHVRIWAAGRGQELL